MGIKGDKLNQGATSAADELVAKLEVIGGITSKKMFGGHGIFHEGKMFAIVNSKGECYFKTDDSNQSDYEVKGAHRHGKMPYFSIPEKVMNDRDLLLDWANKSIEISK